MTPAHRLGSSRSGLGEAGELLRKPLDPEGSQIRMHNPVTQRECDKGVAAEGQDK